jgi:hypothetical protein
MKTSKSKRRFKCAFWFERLVMNAWILKRCIQNGMYGVCIMQLHTGTAISSFPGQDGNIFVEPECLSPCLHSPQSRHISGRILDALISELYTFFL